MLRIIPPAKQFARNLLVETDDRLLLHDVRRNRADTLSRAVILRPLTNKDQHFVPRVYLRQFHVPGIEKKVGIANIKSGLFVTGSIAGQCQESYFYGKE